MAGVASRSAAPALGAGSPGRSAQEQELFQGIRKALRSGEPLDLLALVTGCWR